MNLASFTENTSNPSLTRAVVKQHGRWVDWKESASDIASYGADGGCTGYTYYTDTVAFYEANQGNINEMAREMASNMGETDLLCEFVASFNCVDLEAYEVEDAMLEGDANENYAIVANALAWYALEETAREYVNQLER